jgi:hypothetical protein
MKRVLFAAVAVVALGALAGCETATPYQPLRPGAAQSGGYSDLRLEQDRWRVTFRGNSVTSRETVETYLLYRAAELTVAQGYDWFETVQRQTDKHSETVVDDFGPGPYGPYGPYWRPYWRVYGGWGWRGGFYGDPFWNDFDVQQIERYETSAEIVMHHGPKPADDKHAFDARDVMRNLASRIQKPS